MDRQVHGQGTVEMVRRTMTAAGRRQSGLYPIEGFRLHERALRAGLSLELTLIADTVLQDAAPRVQQLLRSLQSATRQWQSIPNDTMTHLVDGRGLGHLISLVKIPADIKLADVSTAPSLLLVAHEIVDPGNVGAMVRTGHASGISAFVTVGVSDPYHPKAVRTSMGSLFKTAICHYEHSADLLADLQQLHIQTVGTTASDGRLLPQAPFSPKGTAVFMGNEYHGLPDDLRRQLDCLVTIPMIDGIDSLSVNAATAVILYEIRRRGSG